MSGATLTLLDSFARQWGMPALRREHSRARRGSLRPLPHALRAEATRRLYLHMGMFRAHERLVGQFPFLRVHVGPAVRAEIAWQRGRYRRARADWDELHKGEGLATAARRWERRAAVLWIRGSYLRAYAHGGRSARLAIRSGDAEAIGAAFETQARILVHAYRTRDLRWFSTDARRSRLAERINHVLTGERFGVHLDVRLRDARALLVTSPERGDTGQVADETPQGAETFNQYESLSAVLDFRRGTMRARVGAGLESMTRDWLDAYRSAAHALGKDADARSILTLPGAPAHYSLLEGMGVVARTPATGWHRFRLAVWFVLSRMPHYRSPERRRVQRPEG